jgi:hypothetical protein
MSSSTSLAQLNTALKCLLLAFAVSVLGRCLLKIYVGQEQYMITPGSGFDGDANGPQAAFRALMVAGVPVYPDPYCPEEFFTC